jgi:hypothetical protein
MRTRDFQLERYFAKHEFSAQYLLSASDCEPLSLAELLALASPADKGAWEGLQLSYTETAGHPELRARMARDGKGWQLDLTALERFLQGGAQLVVVNFPHNPTGFQPSADELGRILEMAAGAGARVFCDEMYRGLELRGADRQLSFVSTVRPHLLS